MPEALSNSLERLPIQLTADDLAEIIIRREEKAARNATAVEKAKWKTANYRENRSDLLRLALAIFFGRKGG